jgi:hypothetical protein
MHFRGCGADERLRWPNGRAALEAALASAAKVANDNRRQGMSGPWAVPVAFNGAGTAPDNPFAGIVTYLTLGPAIGWGIGSAMWRLGGRLAMANTGLCLSFASLPWWSGRPGDGRP